MLTTSVGDNAETHGSTAQYFIGDFDGFTFFPEDDRVRFTDAGQDFYAAQTFEKVEAYPLNPGYEYHQVDVTLHSGDISTHHGDGSDGKNSPAETNLVRIAMRYHDGTWTVGDTEVVES